jgi:hypothetical protein
MVVAPVRAMTRILKLAALASVLYFIGARLKRRSGALPHTGLGTEGDPGFASGAEASAIATESGLSEVDPEGLIGFGEGIDPEAVLAAHAEPVELHERLPQPGKNLP